ncbi:hypothetical protein AGABI2DRAFT_176416 [Agaricus bisporus var. bisporus H97]|uniref:hypothetical protein n=1 Tax=Agaricus bisporus var. bisporus (strain H97 / ATCC MYA-4626 / FGSC 10389) TaxID=936046 RepID=UPI00029F53D5|nr:hypothetical protein AGABI2DRAFT_176416 [Agaricus bisporus var. bisporus H97]EKV49792.1 hypothetical protein AGABI2DRAFT_176416 [Agaricus bisporus var. bisporus H97]
MSAGCVFFHKRFLSLKVLTLFLLHLSALLQPVVAVLKNITIDDQNGDGVSGTFPIYAPGVAWANQDCAGCAIGYDTAQLFRHTATAATFMPDRGFSSNTVDFDFNGTAIYIFFTLFYNEGEVVTVNTECNFTVDNEPPIFFSHSGDPTVPAHAKRDYQVPVFSKEGLEYKPHHMRISMSDVTYHVFLSFDYAQYTIDEATDIPTSTIDLVTSDVVPSLTSSQSLVDSPSSSSPSPSSPSPNLSKQTVGIIVGSILGGLAVLAGLLGLLWLYCRDRYPKPSTQTENSGQIMSYRPPTWAIESTIAPSTTGATGSPSFATLSSTQGRSTDVPGSSISGSYSQWSSVGHRIRNANRRMRNLTAEIASASSRSSNRTVSSGVTAELLEEVKKLKREIQILKQSQKSPPKVLALR